MALNNILKKIFGDQSERAVRPLWQRLEKEIRPISAEVEQLSNDELRSRVDAIRGDIRGEGSKYKEEMASIRQEIEKLDYDKREPLWKKIDDLREECFEMYAAKLDKVLPEVFAIVKETARRFANNDTIEVTATDADRELAAAGKDFITIDGDKAIYRNEWKAGGNMIKWDMVHYDVQLIGGMVLHGIMNGTKASNNIAEMATGEGKTLVATLPVFLNALTGEGVHVVTVNDYLAKRDSEWMGPLYQFHGLTVDCIDKTEPNSPERRKAYQCDITFGTNNEFGFDYLRDNMATMPEDLVQRDQHYYAIVDEVDSVLIDDARTPLIISGPVPKGDDQLFNEYKPNVEKVVNAQRKLAQNLLLEAKGKISAAQSGDTAKIAQYDRHRGEADAKPLTADKLLEEGALALFRVYKALPKHGPLIRYLSEEGIKQLMLKTEAKYMQDNNREMPKAVEPLFFVIDEKNHSIELTDKGIEVLTGTTQDPEFFVLPDIAAQLSQIDTENDKTPEQKQELKDSLLQNYAVKAERVHTVNQLLKAYTLFDKDVEYVIDDNKIKIVDEQTGRIMEGRRYSDGLHQAIEAKEGVKVEAATQTYATITLQNYFRMYRKLAGMTGTAMTEAGEFYDIYKLEVVEIPTNKPVIRNDQSDRVYRTKKAKYAAIIDEVQAMVEAKRPVLVGTTSVEISELLSKMLQLRKIPHQVLNAKLHQKEADIVAQAGKTGTVTIATNMAGRGTDIKLSPEVREAGGLAIIGTERHESRRVDRQLRGRAGRQGDPGSSVFFVSFEDTVMRLFANERVVKTLDRLGFKEEDMIESKMVTRSIENAQKRVEENNFGIRKRLVEYDDVMNAQRKGVYGRRQNALKGERIGTDIANMFYEVAESIANESGSFEELDEKTRTTLSMEAPVDPARYPKMSRNEVADILADAAMETYKRKKEKIALGVQPYIKEFVEERGAKGQIGVPVSDGRRIFNVRADIEEAYADGCATITKAWEKSVLLSSIDKAWQEQLREMDELRNSVQNASYEQKDPLVIYKLEAYELWKKMLWEMNSKVVATLLRGHLAVPDYEEAKAQEEADRRNREQQIRQETAPQRPHNPYANYSTTHDSYPGESAQRQAAQQANRPAPAKQPFKAGPKVGRNDPCPCGSGKKYKNCHGRGL